MKPHLIIDAEVASTGGTLLLEVAMALREHRLRPDSLVWSVIAGQDQVKLLVEFARGHDHRLPALLERLRVIPEVKKIVLNERSSLSAPPIELGDPAPPPASLD